VISDIITKIFAFINGLSSGNQMIAGAISLWAMGVVTYLFRQLPQRIGRFLFKHLTTTVTFTSQNPSFHNMLKWFETNGYAEKLRNIKVSEGQWGYEDTIKSVGYGTHVVWLGWVPLWVTLLKEQTVSSVEKETLTLLKIGRSHRVFNDLAKEVSKKKEDGLVDIYYAKSDAWEFKAAVPKRMFDSVIIDLSSLEELKVTIDRFVKSEAWYIKHGIPYTLGIMLYGPPGTGKSSLIKAIASYTDRSIYAISAANAAYRPETLQSVKKNSITVIEDIDSCSAAKKRNRDEESGAPKVKEVSFDKGDVVNRVGEVRKPLSAIEQELEEMFIGNISELLNAMDGIVSGHGRILIMTTNYPEKIDSAIMRPGRCDYKMEVGYLNMEMFRRFLIRFFPEATVADLLSGRVLSTTDLTGAELQKCILDKMTCEEIVLKHTAAVRKYNGFRSIGTTGLKPVEEDVGLIIKE